MLVELFPRVHARYASLPIVGRHLDGFLAWLRAKGYSDLPMKRRVQAMRELDILLRKHGVSDVVDLTARDLLAYIQGYAQMNVGLSAAIRSLVSYLEHHHLLAQMPTTALQRLLGEYSTHLHKVRGLACTTVAQHTDTICQLLQFVGYDRDPDRLSTLCAADLEQFIQRLSIRRNRASLQHMVAHLRAFVRWLASHGHANPQLAEQIDTPRLYRGEKLPRALPWQTVLDFLNAIDRSSPMGRRDYAMFLLIVTYGLRSSEVVALTLDDILWNARQLRVSRPKIGTPLVLPLTNEAGAALIEYLQHDRPALAFREVFLRFRSPAGVLKPTAVTEAFQGWVRRGGLPIAFQGPHCLRHSLAVHLLRQNTSLKTIGDLLGHRSAESTCVYLRLHTDELREVALDLPELTMKDRTDETH